MEAKEEILRAALEIASENGGDLQSVTMRTVCERADVSLGLVSYHFGGKEGLMAACAEQIVDGVIDQFEKTRDSMEGVPPYEKLQRLGELTFSYLFKHEAVSRTSILHDIGRPSAASNTVRTFEAFLPLVAQCDPDMDEQAARSATWSLIVQMQQAFLQAEHLRLVLGIDLSNADERSSYHASMLHDVLGKKGDISEGHCH